MRRAPDAGRRGGMGQGVSHRLPPVLDRLRAPAAGRAGSTRTRCRQPRRAPRPAVREGDCRCGRVVAALHHRHALGELRDGVRRKLAEQRFVPPDAFEEGRSHQQRGNPSRGAISRQRWANDFAIRNGGLGDDPVRGEPRRARHQEVVNQILPAPAIIPNVGCMDVLEILGQRADHVSAIARRLPPPTASRNRQDQTVAGPARARSAPASPTAASGNRPAHRFAANCAAA